MRDGFFISLETRMCTSYQRCIPDTHLDLFESESEDASDFEELIEVQANGSDIQWL